MDNIYGYRTTDEPLKSALPDLHDDHQHDNGNDDDSHVRCRGRQLRERERPIGL